MAMSNACEGRLVHVHNNILPSTKNHIENIAKPPKVNAAFAAAAFVAAASFAAAAFAAAAALGAAAFVAAAFAAAAA